MPSESREDREMEAIADAHHADAVAASVRATHAQMRSYEDLAASRDAALARAERAESTLDRMMHENHDMAHEIARLRRQVEAVEAKCNIEIASYKGASGNYDSYHEGRSDAGAVILDAMKEAAETALERGKNA